MSRRRGRGDPQDHCALNVALYGKSKRWALTERPRGALQRSSDTLAIGPSALAWDGSTLTAQIDEVTAPLPSRLRGRLRLHTEGITDHRIPLDAAKRHRWWPIAPCARIEVELERPALRWSGSAYFDTNDGDEPLEDAFTTWDWARAPLRRGAAILYDVRRHDGSSLSVAIRADQAGNVTSFAPPPATDLPPTLWRMARATRVDDGARATVLDRLEDAPFYSRSVLGTHLLGEPVKAVHESLSLDRFRTPWVQLMLPFRMPRARR